MKRFFLTIFFPFFLFSFLFAGNNQRKLRFFVLDLHSSVTADVKNILETMGHEVDFWTIAYYSGLIFNKPHDPVEIITNGTWLTTNWDTCQAFYEKYKEHLNQYDAFIVTHPLNFTAIYEKCNKPIILINPVRYELPFSNNKEEWEKLSNYLIERVKLGKIFIVSNNKADMKYLKHYTGLDSELIPSLCLYTNADYRGRERQYRIHRGRWTQDFADKCENRFKDTRILKRFDGNFTWDQVVDYRGIIHFPYQISTMSIFEQYSANIPLFFPSKRFLYQLFKANPEKILREVSWIDIDKRPTDPGNPNNLQDPRVVKFWLDNADFYDPENMPYIQYFDSYSNLKYLLLTTDAHKISQNMRQHNAKRKAMVFKKWEGVIQKVIDALD